VANSEWDSVDALPDGLDVAQAVVYRENGELVLGGRWLVWPDQVWWERPDGRWQRSVFKPESFARPSWSRVEA
jgi:hypothetical protein